MLLVCGGFIIAKGSSLVGSIVREGALTAVILITLLQSILSVMQIDEAGRQLIYGAVIVVMLLLYGRQPA